MALPLELIPSNRSDWEAYAVCRLPWVDPMWWFPANEDRGVKQARARRLCGGCPARVHCRERAIEMREEGIWGGTSTAERQKLRKNRSRAKCPVCISIDVVRVEGDGLVPTETCMACGASWKADTEPVAQHRGRKADEHVVREDPGPVEFDQAA